MSAILQWAIQSTWFKKYAAIVGAFCLGVYGQAMYWQKIDAIMEVLGITEDQYKHALLLIIAASGIGASIGLSLVKSAQIAKAQTPEAAALDKAGLTEGKP